MNIVVGLAIIVVMGACLYSIIKYEITENKK